MTLTLLVETFELAARCALLVAHGGGDGNTNRQSAQEKLAHQTYRDSRSGVRQRLLTG